MNRYILILAASGLLLLFSSCRKGNKGTDAYGNFEATEISVSSEIPGKILMLRAEEGVILKSGDLAGLIDTMDLYLKREAMLAQSRALVAKQQSIASQADVSRQQKENLTTERERVVRLLKDKAATQKQLDDIDAAIRLADKQISAVTVQAGGVDAEMQSIKKQMEQLGNSLQKCRITSPVTGTVLQRYAEAGEIAGQGKPLFKIASLDTMILRVYISGDQLGQVKLGQSVTVMIDKDKKSVRELRGSISWISPSAEFTPKIIQTREERVDLVYAVKLRVPNDGSLKINMPAEVKFE